MAMTTGNHLTPGTKIRIERLFDEEERAKVEQLLIERCGVTLPMMEGGDVAGSERLRFAALKLSHGQMALLEKAVKQAETDWRDLLMMVGFGHDTGVHLTWMPCDPPSSER